MEQGTSTELRIRYGKSGRVSSATTTAGHSGYLLLAVCLDVVWFLARDAHRLVAWSFCGVVLAVLSWLTARDMLASLTSTREQRAAYLKEISRIRFERAARDAARRSRTMDVAGPLVAATLMFGFLAGIFVFVRFYPLILIPVLGWAYVVGRVLFARRRGGQ